MKKFLLSSVVMFFLCSVSYAQAKQSISKKGNIVLDQKAQAELEKKKIQDYMAATAVMTPAQEATFQAEKLRKEKLQVSSKTTLSNPQILPAALIDTRSN